MHFWYYHSFVCNQLSVYGGGLCFSFSRYLESCATSALKRKSESLSIATSSSSSMSEEDKPAAAAHEDTVNADSKTSRSPFQAFLYPPKTLHRFCIFLLQKLRWRAPVLWTARCLRVRPRWWERRSQTSQSPQKPWAWCLSPVSAVTAAP